MSKRVSRKYDDIHSYVERIEDVLLSESSWSTSDSDCSGCLHLSKTSVNTESQHDNRLELSTLSSAIKNLSKRKGARRNEMSGADAIACSGVPHSPPSLHSPVERGMLRQLSMLTAGAQPWHHNICTSHRNRFAYAATLVIYVYQLETEIGWRLQSILAEHTSTITSLEWHPCDADLIASAAKDKTVCIWSVERQCAVHALNLCKVALFVSWCPGQNDCLSFSTSAGPIQVWKFVVDDEPKALRGDSSYGSSIVAYAWHPKMLGRLVVGHSDGKLSLFQQDCAKVRSLFMLDGYDDREAYPTKIIALAWDLNSADYLLMAYAEGNLWLTDVTNYCIVTKFSVGGAAAVSTIAWLPSAPGMFITGDKDRGMLRVWTVAKKTPLQNLCIKEMGFHKLTVLEEEESQCATVLSSSVVPKVSVLCLFVDGGVGVYSIDKRHWIFNREHGHTETIFDCCFKPDDSDLLATASFDGSIKIWKADTMQAVVTLPNCQSIIYSISWAPADLNCIAAGTSTGRVFIWDVAKEKILQEFNFHKDKKVFCVSWNGRDSRKIASVGESAFCYVTGINGCLLQEYKHPGVVYGCDWRDQAVLATGCDDGKIRIFDVTKSQKECVLELKAHQKKVFRVKWNPVHLDMLCSGSDDASIKIWSYSRAQCLSVLLGHSDNVRGLAWCPEVPHLLVSGSWDRSLRIWDVTTCECLDCVKDHRADVYGLSIHPLRPFLLASCSRDSTVRLWSLSRLVSRLQLSVFANAPMDLILTAKDCDTEFDAQRRLSGLRANHMIESLCKTPAKSHATRKLRLFADLFCADVHVRNLWDLVHVLQGNGEMSSLSVQYPRGIVHQSHLLKCAMNDAAEVESALWKSSGSLMDSSLTITGKQEYLASLYLSCGAIQSYCELMVKMRRWDHALALAPALSLHYWKQLLSRPGATSTYFVHCNQQDGKEAKEGICL